MRVLSCRTPPCAVDERKIIRCPSEDIAEKLSELACLMGETMEAYEKSKNIVEIQCGAAVRQAMQGGEKTSQWKAESDANTDLNVRRALEMRAELAGDEEYLSRLFTALRVRADLLKARAYSTSEV